MGILEENSTTLRSIHLNVENGLKGQINGLQKVVCCGVDSRTYRTR